MILEEKVHHSLIKNLLYAGHILDDLLQGSGRGDLWNDMVSRTCHTTSFLKYINYL